MVNPIIFFLIIFCSRMNLKLIIALMDFVHNEKRIEISNWIV